MGANIAKDLTCPVCKTVFEDDQIKPYKPKGTQQPKAQKNLDKSKYPPKGLDLTGCRPKPSTNQYSAQEWLEKHDKRTGLLLSSKAKSLLAELLNHDKGSPTDKKIIFVQWFQAAIEIGSMLEAQLNPFVYYWVSLSCYMV